MKSLVYLLTLCSFAAGAYSDVVIRATTSTNTSNVSADSDGDAPEKNAAKTVATAPTPLESAKLAFEKFGYVAPMVVLAQTNPAAAEELAAMVKKMKNCTDGGNNYAAAKLAEIYFMQGDLANFEKYASADVNASIKELAGIYNLVLEDYGLIKGLRNNCYDVSNLLTNVFYNATNNNNKEKAKKIIEILAEKLSNNPWNLPNMRLEYYFKFKDEEGKNAVLKMNDSMFSNVGMNADVVKYCIIEDDPAMKEQAAALREKIEKLPELTRYREMYKIYERAEDDKRGGEMLEKLYALGDLRGDECSRLAQYYIDGDLNSWSSDMSGLKNNPKKDLILKLFEQGYETSEHNKEYLSGRVLEAYAALGDTANVEKWIKKQDFVRNNWVVRNLALKYFFGSGGLPKDEQMAIKIIEASNDKLKGEIYSQIGYRLLNSTSSRNTLRATEYFKKAVEAGNFDAIGAFFSLIPPDDADKIIAANADKAAFITIAAERAARKGDFVKAFAELQKASALGDKNADMGLYACYYEGLGTEKDEAKALEILTKAVPEMQRYSNSYNDEDFSFYDARSHLLSFVNGDSAAYKKFIAAASSNFSLRNILLENKLDDVVSEPIEGKAAKVDEIISQMQGDSCGDNSYYKIFNLYSDKSKGFADYEKAFEYALKMYENNRTDDSYIFMILKGIGTPKDEKKAFELMNEIRYNSNFKNAWLAYFYENGIGVEKDSKKAEEFRNKITPESNEYWEWIFDRKFSPQAPQEVLYFAEKADNKFKLADVYMHGRYGVKTDQKKALALLTEVYENNPEFAYEMAMAYKSSKMLVDAQKYFKYLKEYESFGFADNVERMTDVLFFLGCAYLNGWGTDANPKLALEYFNRVAATDSANSFKAREAIAYATENGLGVEKNAELAAKMREEIKADILKKSGYKSRALTFIAACYNPENNFEFAPSAERYAEWLEFDFNNKPSGGVTVALSDFYGKSIPHRDLAKSLKYADIAHKYWPNTAWDLYRQGVFNILGSGRDKNVEEGVRQLEKSASMFYPYAAEMLAYIYENGIGVEKNAELAAKWLDTFKSFYDIPYIDIAQNYVVGYSGDKDTGRAKFILELGAAAGNEQSKKALDEFDEFVQVKELAAQ